MARTKGSGWGSGTLLYQKCPYCGKKKAIYVQVPDLPRFKCTACKQRFNDNELLPFSHPILHL
jgi:transposase-like protein